MRAAVIPFPVPPTAILRNGETARVMGHDEAMTLFGERGEVWTSEGRATPESTCPHAIVGRIDGSGRTLLTHPKL